MNAKANKEIPLGQVKSSRLIGPTCGGGSCCWSEAASAREQATCSGVWMGLPASWALGRFIPSIPADCALHSVSLGNRVCKLMSPGVSEEQNVNPCWPWSANTVICHRPGSQMLPCGATQVWHEFLWVCSKIQIRRTTLSVFQVVPFI